MLSSLLFPTYKLSRKNTQPENMCGMAKGRGRTVNRASVHAEAAFKRVPLKRCYKKFRRIHKKTSVPESLFGVLL